MPRLLRTMLLIGFAVAPRAAHAQWQISSPSCSVSGTPLSICSYLTSGWKYSKTFYAYAQCQSCSSEAYIGANVTVNVGTIAVCNVPVATNFWGGINTSPAVPYVYAQSQSKVGAGSWGFTQSSTEDCNGNTGYLGPPGGEFPLLRAAPRA